MNKNNGDYRKLIKQKELFLKDYKKLCLKHDTFVTACGCCDSPFITTIDKDIDDFYEHIEHLREQF